MIIQIVCKKHFCQAELSFLTHGLKGNLKELVTLDPFSTNPILRPKHFLFPVSVEKCTVLLRAKAKIGNLHSFYSKTRFYYCENGWTRRISMHVCSSHFD